MTTKEKPRCPEAKTSWYRDIDLCRLNDKLCLLEETGGKCDHYEEYLKELKEDESDNLSSV